MNDEPYKVPKHQSDDPVLMKRSTLYVTALVSLCLGSAISVFVGYTEKSIFGVVGAFSLLTIASVVAFIWYVYGRTPRSSVRVAIAVMMSGVFAGSLIWMLILQFVGAEAVLRFLGPD